MPHFISSREGEGDRDGRTQSRGGDKGCEAKCRRRTVLARTHAMHALLVKRADALVGCTEGSPEEEELRTLADAIDAYEAKRWPSGKAAGEKGLGQ